jgi:DNA-binding response OmpR family regulator
MRILVVEDEVAIAAFITDGLVKAGYGVDLASEGAEALHWVAIASYDLIILDVMLPGMDGLALCETLRGNGIACPILMLTARDAIEDRVAGLDSGADDYLGKPFAFAELLARIRALLRRESAFLGTVLYIADLSLDTRSREVYRNGQLIPLTTKEYRLLELLMRHPNQTITRDAIAEHIWNYEFDNVSNLIDVHIHALRRKMDDPYPTKLLHTIRGVGYRLGMSMS